MPGEVGVENGLGAGLPNPCYATPMPIEDLPKSHKYSALQGVLKTKPRSNVCNIYTHAKYYAHNVTSQPAYSSSWVIRASTQSNSPVVIRVSQ